MSVRMMSAFQINPPSPTSKNLSRIGSLYLFSLKCAASQLLLISVRCQTLLHHCLPVIFHSQNGTQHTSFFLFLSSTRSRTLRRYVPPATYFAPNVQVEMQTCCFFYLSHGAKIITLLRYLKLHFYNCYSSLKHTIFYCSKAILACK